jgi:ABC-2 type transport system permease protein
VTSSDLQTDLPPAPVAANPPEAAAGGGRVGLATGIAAVTASQLARARVARAPLLFVAALQSVGILLLLRGVISRQSADAAPIVAGSVVLVAAFVGLNLLAQRFGALRAARALDYYAALPVPPAAVVLGTAASYAGFALPGALVTAAVGVGIFGLPAVGIALAVPCAVAAAVPLAGVGALCGLAAPRAELATVAGQLGMTVVLFLGIIPPDHLPGVLRAVRLGVPGELGVDALADALRAHVDWLDLVVRLAACIGYGAASLAAAAWAFRRAVAGQ